jgi:hypothetical protein
MWQWGKKVEQRTRGRARVVVVRRRGPPWTRPVALSLRALCALLLPMPPTLLLQYMSSSESSLVLVAGTYPTICIQSDLLEIATVMPPPTLHSQRTLTTSPWLSPPATLSPILSVHPIIGVMDRLVIVALAACHSNPPTSCVSTPGFYKFSFSLQTRSRGGMHDFTNLSFRSFRLRFRTSLRSLISRFSTPRCRGAAAVWGSLGHMYRSI